MSIFFIVKVDSVIWEDKDHWIGTYASLLYSKLRAKFHIQRWRFDGYNYD